MTINKHGLNIKSSSISVHRSGYTFANGLFKNSGIAVSCAAVLLIFLIPFFMIVKSCGDVYESNKRNIKILRYHTDDLYWKSSNTISLNWYVLKGDDCYYICVSDFSVMYSDMHWKKVAAFPEYLSPDPKKIHFSLAPRVTELQYTLIPLCILPDSIQVNMMKQLKEEHKLPEHNDYDEELKLWDPPDFGGGSG